MYKYLKSQKLQAFIQGFKKWQNKDLQINLQTLKAKLIKIKVVLLSTKISNIAISMLKR